MSPNTKSIRDLAIRSGGKAHWNPKEMAAASDAAELIVMALELAGAEPEAVELARSIWRGWTANGD